MSNYSCPNANPDARQACAGGSKFVGCCMRDACNLGCDADNLIPATFNTDFAGSVPPLECEDAGAEFYSCDNTSPPFLGCCKSDACGQQSGCPTDQLSGAKLGSDDAAATAFYSPTGAASATASATSSPKKSSSNGAIIGGAVGGVVAVALVIALAFFIWRRRRRSRDKAEEIALKNTPRPTNQNGYDKPAGPTELSASKSVSIRGSTASPPPQYSAFEQRGPIFELDSQQEHVARPVELDGSSTTSSPKSSPGTKSTRRFASHRLSPLRNRRPESLNSTSGSPRISPQSSTFPTFDNDDDRYSRVSSLSPRSPRFPSSPDPDVGRPSPTFPDPIIEEDPRRSQNY